MTVSVDRYKASLAQKVENASRYGVVRVKPAPNWLLLYLLRMNIVALERNKTLDVLTDTEVQGMVGMLELNL